MSYKKDFIAHVQVLFIEVKKKSGRLYRIYFLNIHFHASLLVALHAYLGATKGREMKKLEINLTEEQYQHILEEIRSSNRIHLSEGVFGGYELCLQVSIPNSFGSFLEIRMANTVELGEVEWKFAEVEE